MTAMTMDIERHYSLLGIGGDATDDQIVAAYKKLAFKYHPDKNPQRVEWATETMTRINLAYSTVMAHRFSAETAPPAQTPPPREEKRTPPEPRPEKTVVDPEVLTAQFVNLREAAKDSLYRYYQYTLYRLPIREKVANRAVFNKIIFSIRKSYHAIRRLAGLTDDLELIEHFKVFTLLLFHFYRASECLNIIDSYADQYDVEAYRVYKQGDEDLTTAGKEIFYDRHNRGHFKMDLAYEHLIRAEKTFSANLKVFPRSSWAVETGIKLEFARSLRSYVELFFSEHS